MCMISVWCNECTVSLSLLQQNSYILCVGTAVCRYIIPAFFISTRGLSVHEKLHGGLKGSV